MFWWTLLVRRPGAELGQAEFDGKREPAACGVVPCDPTVGAGRGHFMHLQNISGDLPRVHVGLGGRA